MGCRELQLSLPSLSIKTVRQTKRVTGISNLYVQRTCQKDLLLYDESRHYFMVWGGKGADNKMFLSFSRSTPWWCEWQQRVRDLDFSELEPLSRSEENNELTMARLSGKM